MKGIRTAALLAFLLGALVGAGSCAIARMDADALEVTRLQREIEALRLQKRGLADALDACGCHDDEDNTPAAWTPSASPTLPPNPGQRARSPEGRAPSFVRGARCDA